MKQHIYLGFMEDTQAWCNAWCVSIGCGSSGEDAAIAAALAQYAFRDIQAST